MWFAPQFRTGTLGVGGLLLGTGAGMGLESYSTLMQVLAGTGGPALDASVWIAFATAAASIAVKETLFHRTLAAGIKANSKVVQANAWHHRTDAVSSLVAMAGISGSLAGVPYLDPAAAGVVSLMILRTGAEITYDSLRELADEGLEGEVLSMFRVYQAADGVVADEVLQQWLNDFDKYRGKPMLNFTSKNAANSDTRVVKDHRDQRWKERKKYDEEKDVPK
ncbi:hypothetical protein CYMTET_35139 [Cymbomonas tetramitiformis]|uniref:Cation efflux protein transmembrane domain-containing protein n=1 Tax=Cymbomonas tetramitiformis TaxID=36881 RepID=A0AAE0KP74_9CHLO|nr:hypothetical protein CYMTET_35139 [Cymbomonas tetramitiformis]